MEATVALDSSIRLPLRPVPSCGARGAGAGAGVGASIALGFSAAFAAGGGIFNPVGVGLLGSSKLSSLATSDESLSSLPLLRFPALFASRW